MLYNIEKELPCIRKQINFESEPMKSAFSIHILDELKKNLRLLYWKYTV